MHPVLATTVVEQGGTKDKVLEIKLNFFFVSARHWSAGLVAGRNTLGVGGLSIFFVAILWIGALRTAVG